MIPQTFERYTKCRLQTSNLVYNPEVDSEIQSENEWRMEE